MKNTEIKKIELPIETTEEDHITPKKPALKWLGKSLIIIIIIAVIWFLWARFFADIIVKYIDIPTEKAIFWKIFEEENEEKFSLKNFQTLKNHEKKDEILQLFEEVYIEESSIENAYAMIGGRITITDTLLSQAKNEEEILFILGHEMGHIQNRDVLRSLARSMPIKVTLEMLWLNSDAIRAEEYIMTYLSREAEFEADKSWQNLLDSLGLNSACATRFFEENSHGFEKYTSIISTHPDTAIRLENLKTENKNPDKSCTPFNWEEYKMSISEDK